MIGFKINDLNDDILNLKCFFCNVCVKHFINEFCECETSFFSKDNIYVQINNKDFLAIRSSRSLIYEYDVNFGVRHITTFNMSINEFKAYKVMNYINLR